MNNDHNPLPPCHFCSAPKLQLIRGYETLHRVTSDCQPIKTGGKLAVCSRCGGVQKPIDDQWREVVHKIYSQYQIYHQSGGMEQVIFDQHTGQADTRSSALLKKLFEQLPTPPADQGRLLDVGCGNGALLAAFHQQRPNWQLTGTELSDDNRERVLAIPGVESFHVGQASDVPGVFDLISFIHVLEHVPQPAAFLASFMSKLVDDDATTETDDVASQSISQSARLLIEVPDHTRNPFDLLIADHSAHFTRQTLGRVIVQAGYGPLLLRDDIVPKELSAAAGLGGDGVKIEGNVEADAIEACEAYERVSRRVAWLEALAALGKRAAERGPLGVFGTSIAGTWLGATLGDGVSFYVDEDTARHGRRFMGRPVMGVEHAPAGVPVLLALPPWLASDVARRLSSGGAGGRKGGQIEWLLPPALD